MAHLLVWTYFSEVGCFREFDEIFFVHSFSFTRILQNVTGAINESTLNPPKLKKNPPFPISAQNVLNKKPEEVLRYKALFNGHRKHLIRDPRVLIIVVFAAGAHCFLPVQWHDVCARCIGQ